MPYVVVVVVVVWRSRPRDGCYGLLTDMILETVINHYSLVGLCNCGINPK